MWMNDQRWGFEEGDEWDEVAPTPEPTASEVVDELLGQDPDGAVTVVVAPDAAVLEVRVDPDWRRSVDPRALNQSVMVAANNATMRALAWQVKTSEAGQPVEPAAVAREQAEETPLTKADVRRLLDAVAGELEHVSAQLPALDRPVAVTSSGRHVTATSLRGQVVEVTVAANWAASARAAEIEAELFDVLARLRRESTPERFTAPQGSAIAELNALASDPQALLRRIGLLHRSEES